ncbi:J domain-containing protein [Noviherbaspirillum sedimenti]|uniref:J domain-containing protein n=1 Tax=Noviherbaspirillum sedimenti TaxID=2320865 RepID=A0A3A3GRJ9_9BURK|nr:J domain-containing protein [Noviherbaspirillum sedimenti]RJG03580.1 J domain-containing protein [Noviherbaspirillum sedimenti]
MPKSQLTAVRIAASDSPLSKGQKTFNRQIQQIEKLRSRLTAWDAATISYQKKYTQDLLPLFSIATELQIKLVHSLDRAAAQKGLTRTERRTLGELIAGLAGPLLGERDDAELKAIYNRHSRSDYDSEEAAQMQGMKDLFEDVFGFDLGDDAKLDSPDEFMQRAQAQFAQMQADCQAEQQAQEERRARRKKSAKQLEKEERAEADARQINQSIREIYRKLASALHPDREPDPQERVRKTALMQRINHAYDKQNLLQLLELQLELEHIDRTAIGRIDEERLRHYNAVLKRQIAELEHETMRIESDFCAQFGISPFVMVKPETVMHELAGEIARTRQDNRDMEQDLLALEDAKGVKAWLKQLRRRPADDDFDGCPF